MEKPSDEAYLGGREIVNCVDHDWSAQAESVSGHVAVGMNHIGPESADDSFQARIDTKIGSASLAEVPDANTLVLEKRLEAAGKGIIEGDHSNLEPGGIHPGRQR